LQVRVESSSTTRRHRSEDRPRCAQEDPLAVSSRCDRCCLDMDRNTFRLPDSLAAPRPESGTLILLAKSSICGNRTANKRHQAGALGYPKGKSYGDSLESAR
jgi:hypothetical protein